MLTLRPLRHVEPPGAFSLHFHTLLTQHLAAM